MRPFLRRIVCLPGKPYLSGLETNLAKQVKADVMECMKTLNNLSVTCDMWTSRATEGYLTVTAHGMMNSSL